MVSKEAKARIKINKLLEEAGWRFFDSPEGKANIFLEHHTKKGKFTNNKLGNDLEDAPDGFIDYPLSENCISPSHPLKSRNRSSPK
ncbi:hypothetical protein [Geobacter argillaceus]|uniref:Type I restriction enzyme R subunit n=1 Tax=Geobacter argillaceus TaxID=345631 RepID=A0A562VMD5_9BACT|nr:hypothetical protein [Geobacter argillaceus]TWJ19048.1 type I restriction enzyme R subunit [Geobacter argillaceus]